MLRHSGELPGQYFLEYYTDHNCRKLKGKIDLDQCEQVSLCSKYETYLGSILCLYHARNKVTQLSIPTHVQLQCY